MKRLEMGIDGDSVFVGLGNLYELDAKFHFKKIDNSNEAPSILSQQKLAYEEWCDLFPEEGRLPFDIILD